MTTVAADAEERRIILPDEIKLDNESFLREYDNIDTDFIDKVGEKKALENTLSERFAGHEQTKRAILDFIEENGGSDFRSMVDLQVLLEVRHDLNKMLVEYEDLPEVQKRILNFVSLAYPLSPGHYFRPPYDSIEFSGVETCLRYEDDSKRSIDKLVELFSNTMVWTVVAKYHSKLMQSKFKDYEGSSLNIETFMDTLCNLAYLYTPLKRILNTITAIGNEEVVDIITADPDISYKLFDLFVDNSDIAGELADRLVSDDQIEKFRIATKRLKRDRDCSFVDFADALGGITDTSADKMRNAKSMQEALDELKIVKVKKLEEFDRLIERYGITTKEKIARFFR